MWGLRVAFGASAAVVLAACAFDVLGSGETAASGGSGASSGPGPASATTNATATAATASTTTSTATGPGSSGGTTAADDSTGTLPVGDVTLDPSPLSFGLVPAGTSARATVTLWNGGDSEATDFEPTLAGSAYALAAAAWPGQGGDCGASLAPGASCTAVIEFAPPVMGPYAGELTLVYATPVGPAQSAASLDGEASQQTGELIVNGSGDDEGMPPVGWTPTAGDGWRTTSVETHTPTRSIFAGTALDGSEHWLRQDVDVAMFAAAIDTGAVHVDYAGWVTTGGPDTYAMRLEFLDDGGAALSFEAWGMWDGEQGWGEKPLAALVPADTRTIRVALGARAPDAQSGDISVYFDDVTMRLQYPPP